MRMALKTRLQWAFVFSLLVTVSLTISFGLGLHVVLIAIPILIVANAVFWVLHTGEFPKDVLRIALGSVGVWSLVFLLLCLSARTSSGQLGYGDYLEKSDGQVTMLGYLGYFRDSGYVALLVFICALATAGIFKKRSEG